MGLEPFSTSWVGYLRYWQGKMPREVFIQMQEHSSRTSQIRLPTDDLVGEYSETEIAGERLIYRES